MSIQLVNVGTNPNDGTGDTPRAAFGKVNANFTAIAGVTGVFYCDGSGNVSAATGGQVVNVITGRTDVFLSSSQAATFSVGSSPGGMSGSFFAYYFGRNDGGVTGLDVSNANPTIRQYGTPLCVFKTSGLTTSGAYESTSSGTAGGFVIPSPDGTRYRVTVANGGTLVTNPA